MQLLSFLVFLVMLVFFFDLPYLLNGDEVVILVAILDGNPVQVSVGLFGQAADD